MLGPDLAVPATSVPWQRAEGRNALAVARAVLGLVPKLGPTDALTGAAPPPTLYSGPGALSLLFRRNGNSRRGRLSDEALAGQDRQKPFGAAVAGLV